MGRVADFARPFAESAVKAYKVMMTPPYEPVVICANGGLQEEPMPEEDRHSLRVPKLVIPSPPAGDAGAVVEAAKMLVAADNPVIVAGRVARTPNGIKLLVELAETLQAGVLDRRFRMNFPTRHPLYNVGSLTSRRRPRPRVPGLLERHALADTDQPHGHDLAAERDSGAKLITITAGDLFSRSNYRTSAPLEVDLAIAADAETPCRPSSGLQRLTPDRSAWRKSAREAGGGTQAHRDR